MATRAERFLVDEEGHKLGVVLDIAEYKEILDDLEELDSRARLRGANRVSFGVGR